MIAEQIVSVDCAECAFVCLGSFEFFVALLESQFQGLIQLEAGSESSTGLSEPFRKCGLCCASLLVIFFEAPRSLGLSEEDGREARQICRRTWWSAAGYPATGGSGQAACIGISSP